MDDEQCAILEKKLRDPSAKPAALTLPFLREITDNFSDERKIGSGGFGEVYKGVFRNETIAVKKLYTHLLLGKKPSFEDEVSRFMGTAHRNVVRLIGFCSDTQADVRELEGRGYVLAEIRERLICFEFVDRGSLGDAIKAEHEGLEWYKRYGIIKGICEGLQYLHEEKGIVHLDLKPANILLDRNLVPKIADFGLSRLFGKEQTTQVTTTWFGTPGYAPPEYIYHSAITLKFDIYSLGVIMQEIITGHKAMEWNVENILEEWKNRLQATLSHSPLEASCRQIRTCLEIALSCQKRDRKERPDIGNIINMLKETEIGCKEKDSVVSNKEGEDIVVSKKENDTVASTSTKLLEIQPPELRFPFEPNKLIPFPLHITNTTDHRIAFRLRPGNPDRYFTDWLCGVVPPGSRYVLTVTMKEHRQPQDPDKFLVEYSIIDDDKKLKNIGQRKTDLKFDKFFKEKASDKVHKHTLMAVCCQAEKSEVISMVEFTKMVSMDVHPTRSWILTGHYDGHIYIWDYATKKMVFEEMVNSFVSGGNKEVLTVKFIARKDWFVAGGADGNIFVYSYATMTLVERFKALEEKITSLAIHPTKPYVLSASYDFKIELWDWENDWNSTGGFREEHYGSVTQVVFNAKNATSYASASEDKTVKISSVDSPGSVHTLTGHTSTVRCLEYFTSGGKQYLITGSDDGTAMIWDLENGRSVKTLEGHANRVFAVCSHPDRPILMTGSLDGTVCIWNSKSFR